MPPTDLLRVRDLVPDFLARAEGRRSASPESWSAHYLAAHPDVVRALRRDGGWSDAAGVASVLDGLRDRAADLAARAETVRALLPGGVAAVAGALGWSGDGGPVECVVLVGLNQANGWAGELNGRYALFLAVEQLGPPEDLDLLVRHEAAHVVHDRGAAIRDWPEYGVANALFTEGLATQVTAELDPGRPDEEYLWFGRPGHRQWLDECRRRWPEILRRVRADLDATDADHHAPYFLMRDSPLAGGLPKRCGYLVGLTAVRHLRRRHTLRDLATWPLPRVQSEMAEALTSLPPPTPLAAPPHRDDHEVGGDKSDRRRR
ncbi:hypothetical protein O7622_14595 [Micromonospora sp. WMMD1076]|uniref:hypothetical protein n=1 Tax=Micromonospora sp. WMMD1076 TaxID=3016103 RepID=UPI002499F9F8|nr:hypothetical protein [Micromonospora sp. WMMD1076]WFF09699.1 hypothetical protein O7622_14595 [Micromonospora sp. WMMD1076]